MSILIGIGLIVLALYGAPLFTIIGGVALLAFYSVNQSQVSVILELYRLASTPVLIAIPLFTFAGYVLAESGTPKRLIQLSRALVGWMPGGLALVTVLTCAVFTAFTGATGVTIIALGGLLFPVLLKDAYSERFSLGLITSSGNIGLLFPPSLPIILYGLVAQVSVDQLFAAGLIPGLLIIAVMGSYVVLYARKGSLTTHKFSWSVLGRAFIDAVWEVPLPFIIIIGIYGGFFTASEAAAITAFYVLVVEFFIYRDLSLTKDLSGIIRDSMVLVGGVLIILGSALGLANYMIDAQIPMKILGFMQTFIHSKLVFLLTLNIFLLLVGAMLDIFSAILVVVPLLIPIATSFGVHPLHLGVIFITNLSIGYLTPPVGMNLFIASFRFNKSVLQLYAASLPFLGLLLLALLVITYVPELSLWLVRVFGIQ
ncbi:TRAP transporter large permease [candidate division CSSED10-310 bacterium]|uniref:TRAP transporter large permease n=1 Tax=candidate division CSSED10-310 bacterium TaxID=2855610 RepID=A0ABV6YTD1_UNCC1